MSAIPGGSMSAIPSARIIDFEIAELRRLPFQDSLYLWVRGRLPAKGMEARLSPRIYDGRPDYWGIEVAAIACRTPDNDTGVTANENGGETAAEVIDPLVFERSVPLTGITGTKGVSVIGASLEKRIDIDSEAF